MPAHPHNRAAVAPSVQTSLWQSLASGMAPQHQQAVNQHLQHMNNLAANQRYIRDCIIKEASCLTNGSKTQTYVTGTPLTFNLPQPNNAFARGIIIHSELNYTLGGDADETWQLSAAGGLAVYDTIEVRYNKSQIKIRPYHLRQLAQMGIIPGWMNMPSNADTGGGGSQNSTLQSYLNSAISTSAGAQSFKQDLYIPFNILSPEEDRGLLPSMPGETGVQVICTTNTAWAGSDPIQNVMYDTQADHDGTITAIGGTVQVIMVYSDGETYSRPGALPYNMNVLDGTIQMQIDNPLTSLVAGSANVNRGKVNILGRHHIVLLLVIDAVQNNLCATNANITYLSSDKDDVGANSFWKYGTGTNLDMNEFFSRQRSLHMVPRVTDLDEGVIPMIQAPLEGQSSAMALNGQNYLDNTTAGWPAWHYGISLTTLGALGSGARIEPFTVYVNPVGLSPVGAPGT